MRPFIQTTAGATFYVGAHYTLMFRKEYVEFIAKMQNGLYGVVNLQFYSDAVELLTDWGDFFKRIFNHEDPEKLMRMLQKPCPLVVDLMEGASGYHLMKQHSDSHYRVGCSIPVPPPDGSLITLAGHPQVMEKAIDLLNYSLRLYCEIFPRLEEGVAGGVLKYPRILGHRSKKKRRFILALNHR